MSRLDIILIGGGGHCHSCIDVIEQTNAYNIIGIIDQKNKVGNSVLGYKIIGTDEDLETVIKDCKNYAITLGQIKSSQKRIHIFNKIKELGGSLPVIISPQAYVSKHSKIAEGTIVMNGAIINANAKIGKNCIINSNSLIEHDVHIQDNCHISTMATINGHTRIGEGSFIGSNSTIKENITIGENCIISMGQCVFKDMEDNQIAK